MRRKAESSGLAPLRPELLGVDDDVRWQVNITSYQLFWHRVPVQDQRVGRRRSRNVGLRRTTLPQTPGVTCRDGED